MALLAATDLDDPYAQDERASEAVLAAEARIRAALTSSPRRWLVPDDLADWSSGTARQQEVYAELRQMARALTHGSLSAGRSGAGKLTVRQQQQAEARLKEIRDGADLGIARDASAASHLGIVGSAVTTMGRLFS